RKGVKMLNKLVMSKNYITKKIILSLLCIFFLIFAYCILNYSQLLSVYNMQKEIALKTSSMDIVLGGEAVGIKLLATGVLVMGIDRDDTNLKIGDVILKVNNIKIESNEELVNFAKTSNGNELELEVNRQGKIVIIKIKPLIDEICDEYKFGLFVKDSSAGVGTVTFYDKATNKFAALGHGVTETKENYILPINTGGITRTNIYAIKKGLAKVPGELKGSITNDITGEIVTNTDKGIYGNLLNTNLLNTKLSIDILSKIKVKEGVAYIYCTLDDNIVNKYEIQIEKVLLTSTGNKNMIIKITDKKLLNKTGGIIQGMSGSPIVQDNKLVGAITHVLLNDPTRGYGVFIENMIDDMSKSSA
ncbi:MAG: SpoIVB peptidase, partial [Clostridia bacterium]